MSKTPEELAEEYGACIDLCCGTSDIIIAVEKGFLAGYQAGVKEAEQRILNEFFDNYGADEHANFALRVNAYQWTNDDK